MYNTVKMGISKTIIGTGELNYLIQQESKRGPFLR